MRNLNLLKLSNARSKFIRLTLSYDYMKKVDFLYFQVETPNRINFIMFWDSSDIFCKIHEKKLMCVFE